MDTYPLPRIEDLLPSFAGGKLFNKLDLAHAYQQIKLEESRKYVTINTHKGLFQYAQLPDLLTEQCSLLRREECSIVLCSLLNCMNCVNCKLDVCMYVVM